MDVCEGGDWCQDVLVCRLIPLKLGDGVSQELAWLRRWEWEKPGRFQRGPTAHMQLPRKNPTPGACACPGLPRGPEVRLPFHVGAGVTLPSMSIWCGDGSPPEPALPGVNPSNLGHWSLAQVIT